jgi:hypothetical protein
MKCYGNDESETPIVLNREVDDKGKNRQYVGILPFSKHPDNLCMPCCFKKFMDTSKTE